MKLRITNTTIYGEPSPGLVAVQQYVNHRWVTLEVLPAEDAATEYPKAKRRGNTPAYEIPFANRYAS